MRKKRKLQSAAGDRYGLLTVLKDIPNTSPREVLAKCECGNTKEIKLHSLKSGITNSCGCLRIKNEVGERFGKLKVMSIVGKDQHGKYMFDCLCDCGKRVVTLGTYLRNGDTKSCGCEKDKQDEVNLREKFEDKRVEGVAMQLFNDKPQKNSSTGFRGVFKYLTRVSKQERYGAWITVQGAKYYKKGFHTPEDAYYNGRRSLEREHLPKTIERRDDKEG